VPDPQQSAEWNRRHQQLHDQDVWQSAIDDIRRSGRQAPFNAAINTVRSGLARQLLPRQAERIAH
jgi:hypothetical protein